MNADRYAHVVKAIFSTPWAIYPPTLEMILDVVRFRAQGGQLSQDEIQERLAAAQPNGPRAGAARSGLVAVLPMYGIIAPRMSMLENTSSGGVGLDRLTAQFRAALADEDITAICFDIDSPGGTVDGVEEFAAEVRAARGLKPMAAVANYMAASAAYYIAAQADEIVVSPSGQVGSIGVLTAHQDLSEAYAQAGVKTTLIKYGKYKAESNEFEPLSEEARAELQSRVDEWGGMFEAAVAKGRGVTPAKVRSDYGQGRMFLAKRAKDAGLADRIDTLEGTIVRLGQGKVKARPVEGAQALYGEGSGPRLVVGMTAQEALGRAAVKLLERAQAEQIPAARLEHARELRARAELTIDSAVLEQLEAGDDNAGDDVEAKTTTTTTTITETVTEDDDEQDVETPDDNAPPEATALATGPTFTARLTAVAAEAEAITAIARSRAERRTDRKQPLSAAHRTELETLKTRLLATAAAIDALDEAPADPSPGLRVNAAELELQIAAYRGGYQLKPRGEQSSG